MQGEASMITVMAAGIERADNVLDVCGPRRKSIYAAQIAGDGHVVAADIYPHRVELIRKNAERLGAANVDAVVQDATAFRDDFAGRFDVVLADVPCSALGLLYRKPDIKLFKDMEDIGALVEAQRAILENSGRYVKKGGTLLYSTCTIDKRENYGNVEWFLRNNKDFVMDDIKNHVPEGLMSRTEGGAMQLFPHIDNIDGFFMARMVKV